MVNLPDFSQISGSYFDLSNRMTKRVQQSKVDNRLLEIVQETFEKELNKENIPLSQRQ